MDNTSDTLTLAKLDNTSDSPTQASLDNTSDTPTQASPDNTPDTPTQASPDNTPDTLTLASLNRENQGPWEFEYSYGGEADLYRHYTRCKKNPGHKNFIPVDKFCIEDLPDDYRDVNVYDYIRAVSDLTVRVTVAYVSDQRPANVPGSRKSYPGYKDRGQQKVTVGTGRVDSVLIYNNREGEKCKCKDCQNSPTPELNFARITIYTAAHVVFDDLEGEHTTCHLFFDRGLTPDTCSGVVNLTGMSEAFSDAIEDKCYMNHHTHDLDLAQRLHQTINQMKKKRNICNKIRRICKLKQRRDDEDRQPLLFIVSHPHGCSKQVSLGRWARAEMFNDTIVSFLYNAATCPGSSGAQVYVLEKCSDPGLDGGVFPMSDLPFSGVHCGISDADRKINHCRNNRGILKPRFVTLKMLQLHKGPWEDNFCSVEEQYQNQHYAVCKKNPGHGNFVPVDKFRMDHLPLLYQRDDLMEFIKLVSDLTVRVSVKYVSENRPETVPETDIPYPWSSNRGSHLTRVGTGWIFDVELFDCDCRCKECRNSVETKPLLAYIGIETASHLVYDKLEAEHSTCDLYFDSGDTPDVCTNVVRLTEVCSFNYYPGDETCRMLYFSHNPDLVRSLQNMRSQYNSAFYSLSRNRASKSRICMKQNCGDNAELEPSLHVVVSHPHGCAKQVSICCCGNPGNADAEDSQCSHVSIVCPGSCGAPVINLSWRSIYPVYE